MNKMRIFHVCPNFYPVKGGIESFVYELSKYLVKDGHEVTVVTGNRVPSTSKRLLASETKDGINIRRFEFKKVSRYNTSVDALKFLLSSDFDILHIHGIGFFSDAIPLIKASGRKKVIMSTHGGIFHTRGMAVVKNIYFNTMARIAGRFADKIIAVSKQDKKFMERIADKKKVILVGNGIEWKEFSRIKNAGNGKTLLYFGRLASNKKIDKILHVVALLKNSKKYKDVKLIVAGPDWGEMKKLKSFAKSLDIADNVTFTGEVTDARLKKIIVSSDVFLLASDYEGFGISIVAAMASGLPVVVNDIETMRELVKNGKNGYIVDFDDYHHAAAIVLKLLEDKGLRRRIGSNGRSYAKRYDWSIVSKEIEKIYRNV